MTDREMMDLVRRIESEHPVDEWQVQDVGVWPLLRVRARFQAFYGAGFKKPKSSRWDRLRGLTHTDDPALGREVVYLANGSWEGATDRIAQPFLDRFGARAEIWQPQYPRDGAEARWIRAGLDRATLVASVRPLSEPDWWATAVAAFEGALPDWKTTGGHISRVLAYADYFEERLAKAKLVLRTCWYDNVGMGLCLAARRKGIPCIDVQHGMVASTHVGYVGWSRFASPLLPTGFWLWREEDRELMADWEGHAELIVGGNLWLEDNQYIIEAPPSTAVLFCANGVMDEIPRVRDLLERLAELPSLHPAHLVVRVHPGRPAECQPLVEAFMDHPLVSLSENNLAYDLATARIHVTSFSSTAIEAETMGVPTVFLDPMGPELFPGIMARGMGFRFEDLGAAWDKGPTGAAPNVYPEAWGRLEALIRHSD